MKLKALVYVTLLTVAASLATAQQNPSLSGPVRSGQSSSPSLVDWVQFHFDPALDGYNPYETILSPTTVGNLTPKWSYAPAEGRVEGQPAVVNGVMYFATTVYCCSSEKLAAGARPEPFGNAVYALNADTGAFIWKFGVNAPVFGSPAVADGLVYVASDALYALDASTGALVWQYQSDSNYSSPTVVAGIVYITSADNNVYALNAKTGAPVWQYSAANGRIYDSPAVANGVLYFNSGTGTVYALNASTGALLWKKEFGSNLVVRYYLSGGTAGQAVANGALYVGIFRKPNAYDLYALDASTGAILWRAANTSNGLVTPAVANGMVYVVNSNGLAALNAATGAVVWQSNLYSWSPVVANGVVYAGSLSQPVGEDFEGIVYSVGLNTALDANTGALLWQYKSDLISGYDFFPTPAVVNGMIYGSRSTSGVSQVGAWGLPN